MVSVRGRLGCSRISQCLQQLFAHPFQDAALAAGYLDLRCAKNAGRFALGSACKKAQPNKLAVPIAEPIHHLRKADPVGKCLLRGVDRYIEFLQAVLIIGGRQAQGRQRGPDGEGDLLRGRAQGFCQFGDARLLPGTL